MMIALNSLTQWDKASDDEQAVIVAAVIQSLPSALSFMGFEWYALGAQRHRIATFRWQDVEFSLLPGYDGELGVDRDALFDRVESAVSATFPDKEDKALAWWEMHIYGAFHACTEGYTGTTADATDGNLSAGTGTTP